MQITVIIAIVAIAALFLGTTAAVFHFRTKRHIAQLLAEIAQLPDTERSATLASAIAECERAYAHLRQVQLKHNSYKWGYRHNPYRIMLITAQAAYAGAHAWHLKLVPICPPVDAE
jgi:hypothetical protein